ncbi:MAG TPA: phage tail sheath protein [Blastocatellia bacterium]|nr:phage tail sheath protein [Blastocatellia bacterium]
MDFTTSPSLVVSDPNRTDIACLVGFVTRRATPVPDTVKTWLREHDWSPANGGEALLDVPIPIDTWELFDYLFAWERRAAKQAVAFTTYLGAAVRSYFAQGGRKCYVVRVGDSWAYGDARKNRLEKLKLLLPGWDGKEILSPVDRTTWRGVGHLFGLSDVSFLCLPDLAEIVGADPRRATGKSNFIDTTDVVTAQFVECGTDETPTENDSSARFYPAPRCGTAEYEDWARAMQYTTRLLAQPTHKLREIQFVAAAPIPQTVPITTLSVPEPEQDLMSILDTEKLLASQVDEAGCASAFLQLAYPWVRTRGSQQLPEQLESPDAVLTGLLARSALTRGAFQNAAGSHLGDVYALHPIVPRAQMIGAPATPRKPQQRPLLERVSLFGPTPGGLKLLSDVTTSRDESYRPANVNRLVSLLVRAARRLGEELVFEPSGEALWEQFRQGLTSLMLTLWQEGALRGEAPEDAFQVRCDHSTMTQNDLDNGRVVAFIQLEATLPIERITVVLAMNEGGQVAHLANRLARKEAA